MIRNVIYDPHSKPVIFDGLLDVFSTCRDCGAKMKVITAEEHSHPTCATVQTHLESLADLLASELTHGEFEQAEMTERTMETVKVLDLGAAAYEYTKADWPVFPLTRHGKTPAIPKRKGGKGYKDATTDSKRIEKWWSRHPDHNIGLATGHMFDVIDIDTKDSDGNPTPRGINSFIEGLHSGTFRNHKRNCKSDNTCRDIDCPPFQVHAIAVTASGGMHLYVKPTGKSIYAGIRPGIDYRGLGGYVVAPPSTLGKPGRDYTWLVEPSPIIKGQW